MKLVPQIVRSAAVGLFMAGLGTPAIAGGLMPGNGGTIVLPTVLPPSVRDALLPDNSYSSFDALGQKFGVHDGRLDFFSMRANDGGDFKPLFRGGVGEGGLKLQLKW
ncbi:MAG: hypothetical protein ABI608_03685 [Rhizomicrobium sp.]